MSYELTHYDISLPTQSGDTLSLRLTANSGKIVTRKKIDTVFGVDHPGIELGVDQFGYRWIAHHHYKNQYPTIDREDKYGNGNVIEYDRRLAYFNQTEMLERTLHYWWNGKNYELFSQNCQHFVNVIAFNEHKSDSMENASDAMLLASGGSIILGLLTGNKGLLNFGLGVGAVGGVTKLVSRTPSQKVLPHYTSTRRLRA